MEECDALCTQIAIMVNGRLKCLGSPQHLKSKFGDGYTVIAKVSDQQSSDLPPQLGRFIESTFPGSVLKDVHDGLVHYHVPKSASVGLATLFAAIEDVRERFSIEDYSVSQTTLEQVFLNFARAQRPPNDDEQSECCKSQWRCCCC
jgi:ATP-binding cassette subfamily A (ABC1) protein 3